MMPNKECIDSWNEICADCKMVESDLTNPTESWLTKVLISYLRMFGYRIVVTNSEDCMRERRQFLIKLVRYIDHIYKIPNKTFSFTYYDLLRPTPKKTSHMLRTLINYLYYFNMFKTNVFKMATERLKERQELSDEIKCTIEENIKRHNKSEKIQEEVDSLSKEIPIKRNELKYLNSEVKQRKGQLQQMNDTIKELGSNIDELKAQIRNFKRQLVPDDEGHGLQIQLVKLQENINECEKQTRNAESNLKTHISDNERLQEIIKMVEIAKDILSPDFVENFNDSIKQNTNTEAQVANCEKEKEQLLHVIDRHQKAVKSFQEKLNIEEAQNHEEKEMRQQAIMCRTRERDDLCIKAESILDAIHSVEHSINDKREIQSYIQEQVAVIMKSYT